MAVTSIWRVHGSVGKVLNYVENEEKTTCVSNDLYQGADDLSDVIDYAIAQRKTSQPQAKDGEETLIGFSWVDAIRFVQLAENYFNLF